MYGFRSVSADWIHVRPPISDLVLAHVLAWNNRWVSSLGIPPFPGGSAPISDDLRPVARTESLIGIRQRV